MMNYASMLTRRKHWHVDDARKNSNCNGTGDDIDFISVDIVHSRNKQQAMDQMIGYLGSLQKRAEADFDTQLVRAREQREAKERREQQNKREQQQKMHASIEKHRDQTVSRFVEDCCSLLILYEY
jgi:hypothetical protein